MIKAQVRTLQQVRQVLATTQAMGFPAAAEDEGAPRYREHLQRRHRREDAVSRFDISGLAY